MLGVATSRVVELYNSNSQRPFASSFVNIHKNGVFGGAFQHFPQMSKSFFS